LRYSCLLCQYEDVWWVCRALSWTWAQFAVTWQNSKPNEHQGCVKIQLELHLWIPIPDFIREFWMNTYRLESMEAPESACAWTSLLPRQTLLL
jgi:hypothetical protein